MFSRYFAYSKAKIIAWFLPIVLQKAKHNAWLGTMLSGLQEVKSTLDVFRSETGHQQFFIMQKRVVENILNRTFDPNGQQIEVHTLKRKIPPRLYHHSEQRSLGLHLHSEGTNGVRIDKVFEQNTEPKWEILLPNMSQKKEVKTLVDTINFANNPYTIKPI